MRRSRREYLFSVDGETEEWYINYLEKLINNEINRRTNEPSLSFVKFTVKTKSSIKDVIKNVPAPMGKSSFHLCDYESDAEEHRKRFEEILKDLKYANTNHPEYNYKLGYCNFAFDLWILLHKSNVGIKADRTRYLSDLNAQYNLNVKSMKNYKKKENFEKVLYQISLDDVFSAIERADNIRNTHKDSRHKQKKYNNFTYYQENPDLTIHECIKQILIECGLWKK